VSTIPTDFGLVMAAQRSPIPGGPQTAAAALDDALARNPDQEAIVSRYIRLTYAELEDRVNAAGAVLTRLGLGPGDRVAGSMANHADLAVAFMAAMRLGAIWVGINRSLAGAEKVYMLADIGAKALLCDTRVMDEIGARRTDTPDLELLIDAEPANADNQWAALINGVGHVGRPDCEIDPFAPAAISFTSGTTGRPKGAVHSQHNLMVIAAGFSARNMGSGTRNGVCLPLTLLNLMILGPLTSFTAGSTCIAVDRVDPVGLAQWVGRERITTMSLVPTMLHDLFRHPDVDIDDLLAYFRPGVGGADCPRAWRQLFEEHGLTTNQGYGLTEAPTVVTTGVDGQPEGSSGRALPHVLVTIRDEDDAELGPGEVGEVCVAPQTEGPWAHVHTPMLGYWGKPDQTALALRGGRLHTGDIGLLDVDGFLHLKDRKSDMILRGGANVYPAEVERVLAEDPRVSACAVIGIADERLGQRVVGAVQLAPGATVTEAELQERCAAQLARYKVPSQILLVEELPRSAMGKVQRRQIRSLFGNEP
jgi:long-chain acyl-CoA synthetase